MDIECLSFLVEWFDPQADVVKPYYMNYYMNGTVELVDKNTHKMFLKRIETDITQDDLYIGAIINIYSRQMSIVEASNEYTKRVLESKGGKVVVLMKPDGYNHIGKLISSIEKSPLVISSVRMIRFEARHLDLVSKLFDNPQSDILTQDVSVVFSVVVKSKEAYESWKKSLDTSGLSRFVVHTSHPEASAYFLDAEVFPSIAVCDNCTVCIIRPDLLKEGKSGEIVDEILKCGFEISALELFRLNMSMAEEFFEVYKGIMKHYHEMLKYMISGPCLVLEIRGSGIVEKFREYCGPFDVEVAKQLRPKSLRSRYGQTTIKNGVHCTDCPEDGPLESQYFFKILQIS